MDLRDYILFELDRPSARRVFCSGLLSLDLICLEPEQTIPARTLTASDAVYTVLGGKAWLVTDEAEVTLAPLQAVLVPAGVPHGIRNESADPLILQAVSAPPAQQDTEQAPTQAARIPAGGASTSHAGAHRRTSLLDRVRRLMG